MMSTEDALEELFATAPAATFTRRKEAIPGDLRIAYRLALLVLLLYRFRSNTAALEHLHTMWWAVRSEETRQLFLRWYDGDKRPDEIIVRFDPSLSVTVDLGLGAELIQTTSTGSVALTEKGVAYVVDLWSEANVLREEKAFLNRLPRKMSQRVLKELTEWQ